MFSLGRQREHVFGVTGALGSEQLFGDSRLRRVRLCWPLHVGDITGVIAGEEDGTRFAVRIHPVSECGVLEKCETACRCVRHVDRDTVPCLIRMQISVHYLKVDVVPRNNSTRCIFHPDMQTADNGMPPLTNIRYL